MTEYIEREAVVKYLLSRKEDFLDDYGKGWSAGIGAASGICSEFPAADVAPVVRGRWDIDEFGHYCTVCREYGPEIEGDAEIVDLLKYGTPYCPYCGARMEESESK